MDFVNTNEDMAIPSSLKKQIFSTDERNKKHIKIKSTRVFCGNRKNVHYDAPFVQPWFL